MKYKSIDHMDKAFRMMRMLCFVTLTCSALVSIVVVWISYNKIEAQRQKIYVLDQGKSLMLALSQDAKQNRPVEAREHVRRFHELFFSISPDKSAIKSNLDRALILADNSAYTLYSDLQEREYFNQFISGSAIQRVEIDSICCDFDRYPIDVTTHIRLLTIRETSLSTQCIVTHCMLSESVKSDNNPQGFMIEKLVITDTQEVKTEPR